MRITIYGHEDPRNGIIRYVGQTENVYRRFIEHISFEKPVEPKDFWIQELKDLNLMLIMRTLEVVDGKQVAREREAYWIQHYRYLAHQANVSFFNRVYPLAAVEVAPQIAWEAKQRRVAMLREQDKSQKEILYSVWGVLPGGSAEYAKAREEYQQIIAQLNSSEEIG
jgi:GIY-YIG catalytic domain